MRAEFFGDELDAMGLFDPATQRRTENVERAVLLPAAEALPHLAPGGTAGLAARLEKLAAGAEKAGRHELAQTLRQDREALEQGRSFPATDRYLALIYPQLATAADYLPPDACVLFSESSRVGERAKTYQWQLEEDAKSLMEGGAGRLLRRTVPHLPGAQRPAVRLADGLSGLLHSVGLSGAPRLPAVGNGQAAALLWRQPGDGGLRPGPLPARRPGHPGAGVQRTAGPESPDAAGGQASGRRWSSSPRPSLGRGETLVSVGGLSAGMEYPEARLAVLTEGQGRH